MGDMLVKLNVSHLEVVEAVHRAGSVTKAAKLLRLSQPAVSRRLADLERRLGTQLFRRERGEMAITTPGARVLTAAQKVLEELRRAEYDLGQLQDGYHGVLRVAMECHLCYHWLPAVMKRFAAEFPHFDVQIVPEATREPMRALVAEELDLAIIYHTDPVSHDIALEELFVDELVAVMAESEPLAAREFLRPDDFQDTTLICHYAEPDRALLDRKVLQPRGITPKRVLEMQATPAVMEMIHAGMGISVMPRWVLGSAFATGGLVTRRVTKGGLFRQWFAAMPRHLEHSAPVAKFIALLKTQEGPASS